MEGKSEIFVVVFGHPQGEPPTILDSKQFNLNNLNLAPSFLNDFDGINIQFNP